MVHIETDKEGVEHVVSSLDEAVLRQRQRTNKKIGETISKFKSNAKQIPAMIRQTKATNASIALNKKVSKQLSAVKKSKNKK
jgi:hypothetical protein